MSWELHEGDCMEIMQGMDPESVDAVVTDPPYNIGFKYATYKDNMPQEDYIKWQTEMVTMAGKLIRPGGSFFYLHYPEVASRMFWQDTGMDRLKLIAWIYNQHTGGSPLRRGTRLWCWWTKGDPYINKEGTFGEYKNLNDKRIKQNIEAGKRPVDYDWWQYEQVKNVSSEKTCHPCQLPLKMLERIINMVVPPEGTVLDPFAGSGTTGLAAENMGRNSILIEKDAGYCGIIRNRLDKLQMTIFNF